MKLGPMQGRRTGTEKKKAGKCKSLLREKAGSEKKGRPGENQKEATWFPIRKSIKTPEWPTPGGLSKDCEGENQDLIKKRSKNHRTEEKKNIGENRKKLR